MAKKDKGSGDAVLIEVPICDPSEIAGEVVVTHLNFVLPRPEAETLELIRKKMGKSGAVLHNGKPVTDLRDAIVAMLQRVKDEAAA
jgi:hypothetical protein